jgi:serpin B
MTMPKFIIRLLCLSCVFCGYAEPVPANDILEYVRTKLPSDPITLTGTLKVRTEKGFTKSHLPVKMNLNWGAATPSASYQIGDESLNIIWQNNQPSYQFSNTENQPSSEILGTGLTWADLSFSVLWWPGPLLIDETKKMNRECYVVEVPVPDSENTMRLWIEKKMGMLLEVQTFNAQKKELRRMKIKSIKKLDGMWVAKDLEITQTDSSNKTTLQITDLKREKPQPTATAFDPAESINLLTIDLYKRLSSTGDDNLFLSPYSISTALAMVYGGARGETGIEMEKTLHFGNQGATHPAFSHLRNTVNGIQKKGHIQLSVANSLWPQMDYPFLPDYLAMTKEFYGSEIKPVDYKTDAENARLQINSWVEDQTNDRIKDLIPAGAVNALTRLVLANAIYFKGSWATQFKPEATRPAPFNLADGKIIEVPTMILSEDFRLAYTADFQALELPYEGDDLSMLVLLPTQTDGLEKLEKSLSTELFDGLEFHKTEVIVQLPRFKIESSFNLGKTLAAMGMPLAFTQQADFSGMTGKSNIFIDEVVHKAFVEVNEEGTEAAAATGIIMRTTSMPPQFTANRPFLFLIRENTSGTILFIGKVMDPSK